MRVRPAPLVCAVLALFGCADDPTRLDESEARTLLETSWNEERFTLLLGKVQFVDGAGSLEGRRVSLASLPTYRAFARSGLVQMINERDLTDNFTGWNDWFQLTQNGVRHVATIRATDEASAAGDISGDAGAENLAIRLGTSTIEKIVSNDSIAAPAPEKLRLVQGLHVFEGDARFKEAWERSGQLAGRDRRFRSVLRYDPFESRWQVLATDVGERMGAFATQTVPELMRALAMSRQLGLPLDLGPSQNAQGTTQGSHPQPNPPTQGAGPAATSSRTSESAVPKDVRAVPDAPSQLTQIHPCLLYKCGGSRIRAKTPLSLRQGPGARYSAVGTAPAGSEYEPDNAAYITLRPAVHEVTRPFNSRRPSYQFKKGEKVLTYAEWGEGCATAWFGGKLHGYSEPVNSYEAFRGTKNEISCVSLSENATEITQGQSEIWLRIKLADGRTGWLRSDSASIDWVD